MDEINKILIEIFCDWCETINSGKCPHRLADHCLHRDRHIKAVIERYHVLDKAKCRVVEVDRSKCFTEHPCLDIHTAGNCPHDRSDCKISKIYIEEE